MRPRRELVPPDDIVVAVRSFVAAQGAGAMWIVQEGERFDRHHQIVQRWPDNFQPAESAD
jgi:hypothetical protein